MGWLDKLLGRDKEQASDSFATPTTTAAESDSEAAGAGDHDAHEGHDHPPGEHSHDENV
jgi:hypothetical protein